MNPSHFLPFWTLAKKETLRFFSVPLQTLLAPILSALLFLFVFGVSLGRRIELHSDFTYSQFVVPGLILMGIISNSFANTSSSLFFSRYIGNIVDLLVTPIGPFAFLLAYTLPSILRGCMVGFCVWIVSLFFVQLPWAHPFAALTMLFLVSFLFSQLGLIAAIYSDSFEMLSMYNNFLLLPLTYFGGMFYPLSVLPEFWKNLSHANPLYYMIDGFRYSLIGMGETNLGFDLALTATLALALFLWNSWIFHKGYRLRS